MKVGRPKEFVEEEALNKAIQLFWDYGYEATSTEDLLSAMKMGKGSMYHNFGGKREVAKLALEKFGKDFIKDFTKTLEESSDHIEFIKDYFRKIAAKSINDYKRGCFMGNIIIELAPMDQSLEKIAIKVLKDFEQILKTEIVKAQKTGKLKTKENPNVLARYLLNLWNGVYITARMYPEHKELTHLIEFQLQVLH